MEDYHYDSDSGNESSDDDVELEFDSEGEGSGSGNRFAKDNDEYPYEVLSTEEVSRHMLECIKEFISVANISHTTARLLLSHFRWDKEKLMERFYDSDQEKLFLEAQVPSPYKKLTKTEPVLKGSTGMEECSICCLNMPPKLMFSLDCGHRFCSNCWCEYITTKVIDEGTGQSISCAGHGCQVIIEDSTVITLLQDAKVKLAYQHRIAQSFVECNRQLRWCPYPDCKYVVKVQYPCARRVVCRCHNVFCFSCGHAWHDPVKCPLLKRWIKKCDDDSETSNWISANTKECPKCKVTIEKDGGCNHMVCKNVSCKSEFCWVCLGPWEPHGSSWYSCNRYDEFEAKQARDAQEKSRSALQRYLFYYNRYMNHMQSLKLENKLNLSVKEKMDEMQQHNMSWIEVQFLQKAVDILCECRQTLMYTYVFAYYLQKNNQSVIFEDNQRDLEASTEKLSEYLERDMQDSLDDIKQKVQDKYRYCEQRRKKLLEHVHEGYDQDWWEYKYGA